VPLATLPVFRHSQGKPASLVLAAPHGLRGQGNVTRRVRQHFTGGDGGVDTRGIYDASLLRVAGVEPFSVPPLQGFKIKQHKDDSASVDPGRCPRAVTFQPFRLNGT
jgi:hypothetical protein